MIIDSHAHYTNGAYRNPFRYLTRNEGGFTLAEGDRQWLFKALMDADILYSIEPGVSLQSCEEVLKLGYHFGIGGSLLQQEERAGALWEAVKQIPLDKILVETDSPFILPYCKDVIQPKLLRRARNTSLILLAVIAKIAELKGISDDEVEQTTTENVIQLFNLATQV